MRGLEVNRSSRPSGEVIDRWLAYRTRQLFAARSPGWRQSDGIIEDGINRLDGGRAKTRTASRDVSGRKSA